MIVETEFYKSKAGHEVASKSKEDPATTVAPSFRTELINHETHTVDNSTSNCSSCFHFQEMEAPSQFKSCPSAIISATVLVSECKQIPRKSNFGKLVQVPWDRFL